MIEVMVTALIGELCFTGLGLVVVLFVRLILTVVFIHDGGKWAFGWCVLCIG